MVKRAHLEKQIDAVDNEEDDGCTSADHQQAMQSLVVWVWGTLLVGSYEVIRVRSIRRVI